MNQKEDTEKEFSSNESKPCNKADRFMFRVTELNKEHSELNLGALLPNKTLYEIMHRQTRYQITTNKPELNEVLASCQKSDKHNDTYEIYYTKNFTFVPLLYNFLINVCSPEDLSGFSLDDFEFQDQKAIIYNYTDFFEVEIFEKEFLRPFFEENLYPFLNENFDISDVGDSETLFDEYLGKVLCNIVVVDYFCYLELLLKIQDLPNLIRKVKEVSLVIVDSPNMLINQTINMQHNNFDETGDELGHRRANLQLNKKRRKSLEEEEVDFLQKINYTLSRLQFEFNFNLVLTLFDYDRAESLGYLRMKSADYNFIFDNKSRYFNLKKNEVQFIFELKDKYFSQRLVAIEPISYYYDCECNIFAYLFKTGEGGYKFKAFLKNPLEDAVNLLIERDIAH